MDIEVQELIDRLNAVKSVVRETVELLGDDGVKWSPDIADTNSAAVLVTHMLGSEAATIHEYIGGIAVNRDRDSEFTNPLPTVHDLVGLIDRVGARSRDVLSRESSESLGRHVPTRDPGVSKSVRRSIIGVLMHETEHVGHMQLAEQLSRGQLPDRDQSGGRGLPPTRW
jgi:hypothetical protein